ncbi:MAG: copper amine oxidase N-terminal domain-containing protein [Defluviitaleaceae bacterium]|nr:copper amine oxidase N-terminal domain-containing protein [Defluviitaleaceae bacterium]
MKKIFLNVFAIVLVINIFAIITPVYVHANESLHPRHAISFSVYPAISVEVDETQDGNEFTRIAANTGSLLTVDIDTQNISSLTHLWVYLSAPGVDTTRTLFRYSVGRDSTPENWGSGIITVTHELNESRYMFYSIQIQFRRQEGTLGARLGNITLTNDAVATPAETVVEDITETEAESTEMSEPITTPVSMTGAELRLQIGTTTYTQKGIPLQMEAAPFITEGRTMIPLALIAEALGVSTRWDGDTRSVIMSGPTFKNVPLTIDVPLPNNMGTPVIVSGRTFVPIAYISEMLGAAVRWDGNIQAVYIYR